MLDIIIDVSRISPLIAGIFTLLLGFFVLVKNIKSFRNRIFFWFCCLLFFWAFGCYIQSNTLSYDLALKTDYFLYSAAVLFPISLVALVNSFILKTFKRYFYTSAVIGAVLFLSNWFYGFRVGVNLNFGARYVTTPDIGWYVFLVFFSVISSFMLWELYKKMVSSIGAERKNFLNLFWILNILILGGGCYFFLILFKTTSLIDSLLNLFSSLFLTIFSVLMSNAIAKHELMEIKVIINRSAAYILTFIIFVGGYLGLFWAYYLVYRKLEINWVLIVGTSLYVGVGVGLHFHRVQRYLQTSVYKKFLKLHYDFEKVLLRASKQLALSVTTEDVLNNLLSLQDSLDVGVSVAMIRHDHVFDCYQLALSGQVSTEVIEGGHGLGTRRFFARLPESNSLLQVFVEENSSVVLFDSLEEVYRNQLRNYNVQPGSVCLIMKPLNQLQAVFVIGPKLSEEPYNLQDKTLFEIVVNQAVLVFERIEKIDQLAKSQIETEKLNEELGMLNTQLEKKVELEVQARNKAITAAQSLSHKAVMSTLTAGISHEIQNPLTSIKSNVENLNSRLTGQLGEDRYPWTGTLSPDSFIKIVGNDIEKATQIVTQLQAKGYLDAQCSVTDVANPFYDELVIRLEGGVAEYSELVTQMVGEEFKHKQVLEYLQLVSRESVRVVSITNAMLQYGAAKGVGQEAFSKLEGYSAEKSAKLWQELVDQKYMDAFGGLLSRFTPEEPGFSLALSEEFKPQEADIIHILQTLPGAQRSLIDPGLPLEHAIQLKRADMVRLKIVLEMDIVHSVKVFGDQNRLFQVFNILLSNAMEAIEREPEEKLRQIVVKSYEDVQNDAPVLVIAIRDTGCGMDEETLKKARDPFFTTKGTTGGKNAGLGVSILFDIVENHGGHVTIHSEVGVGTTFTLFFPKQ